MGNREEALRRIFDAAGVGTRLTDDQKRELLAHLEDAVEKKVSAGVPEMDAVGQAFGELGDLQRIAREFPSGPPAAVTPEGSRFDRWFPNLDPSAFALFVFFVFIQLAVMPGVSRIFHQVKVPLPGLTSIFVGLSDAMSAFWPVTSLFVLAMGAALWFSRRSGIWGKAAHLGLLLICSGLCGGALVGASLPLIRLLEGIGHR